MGGCFGSCKTNCKHLSDDGELALCAVHSMTVILLYVSAAPQGPGSISLDKIFDTSSALHHTHQTIKQ